MHTARWLLLVLAVALIGCGGGSPGVPDGADDAIDGPQPQVDAPPIEFRCDTTPGGLAAYDDPDDFGPIALAGTLAGWDPSGRWFLTHVELGYLNSVWFDVQGSQVIVDRDPSQVATLDADKLFHRVVDPESGVARSMRVWGRAADGKLRLERAICREDQCRVCQGELVRAAWPDGEGQSQQMTLLGEYRNPAWDDGYTFNVRVAGNIAYVVRTDGLHVLNIADPGDIREIGRFIHPGGIQYSNDVKLFTIGARRYAVIADFPCDVIDVTTPSSPQLVSQLTDEAHTVFIESHGGKTYAYLGNYDASSTVWDISTPASPHRLGRYQTSGFLVHDLYAEAGVAYLNAWDAGFIVVDFTTPASPVRLGTWAPTPTETSHSSWVTTAGGRRVAVHGEESASAHLSVVDVDPASPTFMDELGTYRTRDWTSIHNVMAFGNRAYIAYYQDGVRILDLSDPTHPTLLGYYNTWDPQGPESTSGLFQSAVGIDVDLATRRIYLADSPRGLLIFHDDTPPP